MEKRGRTENEDGLEHNSETAPRNQDLRNKRILIAASALVVAITLVVVSLILASRLSKANRTYEVDKLHAESRKLRRDFSALFWKHNTKSSAPETIFRDIGEIERRTENFVRRGNDLLDDFQRWPDILKGRGSRDKEAAVQRIFLKSMVHEAQTFLKGLPHKGHLLSVITDMYVNDIFSIFSPMKEEPYVKTIIAMMEEGVRQNVTHSEEALILVKSELAKAAKLQEKDEPLNVLLKYLEEEYKSHQRPGPGVGSLPNGQEFYRACLEYHTSLEGVTAEKTRDWGLAEVERIRNLVFQDIQRLAPNSEMARLTSFQDINAYLRKQPEQALHSEQEAVEYLKVLYNDTIEPLMENLFPPDMLARKGTFKVEKSLGNRMDYIAYFIGEPNGEGTFYINLEDLSPQKWAKFELLAVTVHEAYPGHLFQHAFHFSTEGDPPLRLNPHQIRGPEALVPTNFGDKTSWAEGWGLYSERLIEETGIVEKDLPSLLGFHSFNLLRAARLVIDTGIHAFGWSLDKAVEYMIDNTLLRPVQARGEALRYIISPGQAVSYKYGEQAFLTQRQRFKDKLGEEFDLKVFHRNALTCFVPIRFFGECLDVFYDY